MSEAVAKLVSLAREHISEHSDPDCPEYNECDKEPCMWCSEAKKAIEIIEKDEQDTR